MTETALERVITIVVVSERFTIITVVVRTHTDYVPARDAALSLETLSNSPLAEPLQCKDKNKQKVLENGRKGVDTPKKKKKNQAKIVCRYGFCFHCVTHGCAECADVDRKRTRQYGFRTVLKKKKTKIRCYERVSGVGDGQCDEWVCIRVFRLHAGNVYMNIRE